MGRENQLHIRGYNVQKERSGENNQSIQVIGHTVHAKGAILKEDLQQPLEEIGYSFLNAYQNLTYAHFRKRIAEQTGVMIGKFAYAENQYIYFDNSQSVSLEQKYQVIQAARQRLLDKRNHAANKRGKPVPWDLSLPQLEQLVQQQLKEVEEASLT